MRSILGLHGWRLLAYAASCVGIGLAGWIGRTFGELSVDQVLYHLVYADGAAVQMGEIFVLTFVAEVLAFPLAFAAAATVLHAMAAERWPGWKRHVLRASPPVALSAGAVALLMQFSMFSYAAAQFEPDQFGARYVDPALVRLEPVGRPRNLILIYVESLETAYGDPALFGRDLLQPLRHLGGRELARLAPAPGATWTIAGMVASQCAVPLKVYSERDLRRAPGERVFLPGARCLGDLLQARGWHNVFLGGAPLSFAGKGSFLQDHGFQDQYGRDEWQREGTSGDEMNEWGLYDSALFDRARTKLRDLHASGRPFVLSLLTLDTHNPHGFMSPECRRRGARDFAGIVNCGAAQLADFARYARDQGLLDNTVLVVMGDHLAMPNPVHDTLAKAGERRIFNLVIAPDLPHATTQELTLFDMYPTLLELVNLRPEGGRLGLGVSAFADPAVASRRESSLPLAALSGSAAYRKLWDR